MAIKPLKLKRYISEKEAAQLLSLLIGEEISSEDMAAYALSGVVPAYIQFTPVNQQEFLGAGFYMLDRDDASTPDMLDIARGGNWWLDVLPYPLPSNDWLVDSYGTEWKAFEAGTDGKFELADAERHPRIYAPQEVCQVAQILNDPSSYPEWPAIIHSHGPSWTYSDDESDDNGPIHILSPYDDALSYQIKAIKRECGEPSTPGKAERKINWQLVVAGLVELLREGKREAYKTQGAISDEINERHPTWPNASKTAIDRAMAQARDAVEREHNTIRA